MGRREKRKDQVYGPSVPHGHYCGMRKDGGHEGAVCTCPKKHYCDRCDAQHNDGRCPKSVLDDIVAQLEFKERTLKSLIEEVLDAAEARSGPYGGPPIEAHIEARTNELVEKFGNLGISRRKFKQMCKKALHQRWRREHRRHLRETYGKVPQWAK